MVESSQTNYQLTRSLINGSLKANKISCLAHQTLGRQPHYNIAKYAFNNNNNNKQNLSLCKLTARNNDLHAAKL